MQKNTAKFQNEERNYRDQINAKAKEIEKMVNEKQLELRKIKNEFE